MERYYGALIRPKFDVTVKRLNLLHEKYLKQTIKEATESFGVMAQVAASLGNDDVAANFQAMPGGIEALLRAYHRVHGIDDMRRHKIIMVETAFELPVMDGIVLPGKIDMVTRTKDGYWLWEHKTTGNVPNQDSRFRDLQTLLYSVAVEELFGIKIEGIVWDYIHTKTPVPPAPLKPKKKDSTEVEALSIAKGQTTTVELVTEALMKYGLAKKPYEPFLRQVEQREREVMFPRFVLPIVQAENILLRDYVQSVNDIQAAAANPNFIPVRTLAAPCNWCAYLKLCQAALTGGDTDEIKRLHYTEKAIHMKEGDLHGEDGDDIDELLEALDSE
jgi:hypothetical protein